MALCRDRWCTNKNCLSPCDYFTIRILNLEHPSNQIHSIKPKWFNSIIYFFWDDIQIERIVLTLAGDPITVNQLHIYARVQIVEYNLLIPLYANKSLVRWSSSQCLHELVAILFILHVNQIFVCHLQLYSMCVCVHFLIACFTFIRFHL